MKHCLISVLWLFVLLTPAFGQTSDSTAVGPRVIAAGPANSVDTVAIKSYADRFVPRKASLYAAVLPGLGQIYNKRYWKLPFVYGGFIVGGLLIDFYNSEYQEFRDLLFESFNDQSVLPTGITQDRLRTVIDQAKRERDFWIIITGIFYLIQIADAHIDAHLKEFKLNPELKATLRPSIRQDLYAGNLAGFSFTIKF